MVVVTRSASRSELIGPILMENESDYEIESLTMEKPRISPPDTHKKVMPREMMKLTMTMVENRCFLVIF